MDKPLSFSGYRRFITCPKYYEYHDVIKDRPGKKTSALVIGSIMDEVINELLLKNVEDPFEFLPKTTNKWLMENSDLEWDKDDFDQDLVDIESINEKAKELGWAGSDIVKTLKELVLNQDDLSDNERALLTYACRQSIDTKMNAMLDGFMKWVYPKIDKVIEVQTHINTDDKAMHGYLDFICVMKDGKKVLFDLKTSKRSYDYDAVLKSAQLALYADIKDAEYAGFIVLNKTLNKQKVKTCKPCGVEIQGGNAKKCPKCKSVMDVDMSPKSFVQLLVNKLPKRNKDLTRQAMYDTIKCIDNGVFPRNLNQCFWMYGKPCPYVDKCWKGK